MLDDADGKVIVVESVPANVIELLKVAVLPSAIVNVALVAGAVIATLLMLVAEATPSVGVVKLGDVANTSEPEPVSSVTAAAKLADDGVPKNVKMPAPVVVVDGATPAPPPITSELAARAAEEASVPVAL